MKFPFPCEFAILTSLVSLHSQDKCLNPNISIKCSAQSLSRFKRSKDKIIFLQVLLCWKSKLLSCWFCFIGADTRGKTTLFRPSVSWQSSCGHKELCRPVCKNPGENLTIGVFFSSMVWYAKEWYVNESYELVNSFCQLHKMGHLRNLTKHVPSHSKISNTQHFLIFFLEN